MLSNAAREHNHCYEADSGTPTNWGTARQENFGYDALNQLTLANYGDGGGNHTWSYDAAANRNDATTVDNLNRATVIGGVNRAYDILGNTTSIGTTKSMTWDVLNRMTSMTNGSITWDYTYRADGMRVQKQRVGQTDYNTYRYDGQMPIEDYTDATTYPRNTVYLTKYGLGARGIDYIERLVYNPASTLKGFPVYDAHGNMIATLMRTSGNNCSLNDMRAYDAWGGIRSGATTGDPAPRHSANLGHVQDDESGFVYMRARYYDAGIGRFVSQDPSRDGDNWYVYGSNNPVMNVDQDGKSAVSEMVALAGLILIGIGLYMMMSGAAEFIDISKLLKKVFNRGNTMQTMADNWGLFGGDDWTKLIELKRQIASLADTYESLKANRAMRAGKALGGYMLMVSGFLLMTLADFIDPYSANDGMFGYAPW